MGKSVKLLNRMVESNVFCRNALSLWSGTSRGTELSTVLYSAYLPAGQLCGTGVKIRSRKVMETQNLASRYYFKHVSLNGGGFNEWRSWLLSALLTSPMCCNIHGRGKAFNSTRRSRRRRSPPPLVTNYREENKLLMLHRGQLFFKRGRESSVLPRLDQCGRRGERQPSRLLLISKHHANINFPSHP